MLATTIQQFLEKFCTSRTYSAADHRVFACSWQAFGKTLENYFVPGIIVLGLICGGLAARSYNEGATAFLKE